MTEESNQIDFAIDRTNLYREESFTDLKSGAVRRLVPVGVDGGPDESRTPIFIGTAQILTPEGPLPIQASLPANNLKEALDTYADAMQAALQQMLVELAKMRQESPDPQGGGREDSRIVLPGRDF